MSFAILHTEKIKSRQQLTAAAKHNYRMIPCKGVRCQKPVGELMGGPDVSAQFARKTKGMTVRKNAVYGVEMVLTASPKFFRDDPDQAGVYDFGRVEEMEAAVVQFCVEFWGEENILSLTCHLDEATPHWHCIAVPIDPKGKLNCRHFLGGADKMRALQDSWAEKVGHLGLKRGVPAKPGEKKKRHQTLKDYYRMIARFGLRALAALAHWKPGQPFPDLEPKKLRMK